MDILIKINQWYDGLGTRTQLLAYLATILSIFVAIPLNLVLISLIFYAGIGLDRIWWEYFNKPKAS